MPKSATASKETSATAKVSNTAFEESTRFATEIGRVFERIHCSKEHKGATSILKRTLLDFGKHADRYVAAWHAYLHVSGLHSEGCLRAALATVSGNTKSVSKLCDDGGKMRSTSPNYWTIQMQDGVECVLEHLEDIQESLAILIDDDTRTELQSILNEAGIGGRMLGRGDAKKPKAAGATVN